MSATGEPQSLPPKLDFLELDGLLRLPPKMDFVELAGLLRLKVAGEPFPYSFIHEASPYIADPEDLVRGREPAPGTDGKDVWYFCSAPNFHQSAGGAPKRNRQIGGGQERRFWHPEGGKIPIRGPDRKPVGAYWRTLSYVLKVKNPPAAAKSFRNERLGWCMLEFGLQQQDGGAGQQWEICKVYRSPLPRSPSTAAAGEDVCPAARTGTYGVEDSANRRGMSGGDNTCPTPPPAALSRDNQTLSIFEDLGVPADCITTSEGKMSFALVPSEILSGKLIKLAIDHAVEELQKYAGVHRLEGRSVIYLTGNAQMSSFILEKALSVLRSINVTVHKSLQDPSKVAHVSLVVPDSVAEDCVQALRSEFHEKRFIPEVHGAEEECTIPARTSRLVSSSGLKRKAVCQAAQGARPVRAEITDPSGSSVVVETGNDPIPDMATGAVEDDDYLSWLRQEADGAQGLAQRTDTNGITLEDVELMVVSDNHNNAYPLVNDDIIMLDGVTRPDAIYSDLDDGLKFRKKGHRPVKKSVWQMLFGCSQPRVCEESSTQLLVGSLAEDFVAAIRSLTGCCCWATCRKRDASFKKKI